MGSATLGVAAGSAASLAVAREVLFYLSRAGVMAYSGGIPQPVGAAFGVDQFRDAAAGSDGLKYYVSMQGQDGEWRLNVYDTQRGLWHIEDETHATHFARAGGNLYMLSEDGKIWIVGRVQDPPEGAAPEGTFEWMAEFADWYDDTPQKKGISKFLVRLEVDEAQRSRSMRGTTPWETGTWWTSWRPMSNELYPPHRAPAGDHYRLKFEGTGGCRIYSLAREFYEGSALRSTSGRQ